MRKLLGRLLREEVAQAATKYVLVVSVTMVLLVGVSGFVLSALASYYAESTSVVCLPIP